MPIKVKNEEAETGQKNKGWTKRSIRFSSLFNPLLYFGWVSFLTSSAFI